MRVLRQIADRLHHAGLLEDEELERVMRAIGFPEVDFAPLPPPEEEARDECAPADVVGEDAEMPEPPERRLPGLSRQRGHSGPRRRAAVAARNALRPRAELTLDTLSARIEAAAPRWRPSLQSLGAVAAALPSPAPRPVSPVAESAPLVLAAAPPPTIAITLSRLLREHELTALQLFRTLRFDGPRELVNPREERGPVLASWLASCAGQRRDLTAAEARLPWICWGHGVARAVQALRVAALAPTAPHPNPASLGGSR